MTADGVQADQLERAKNLFEFLGRTQQLKSTPPRTTESYQWVTWLASLPEHPAVVSAHREAEPDPEAPLLVVDRVARVAHPEPDEVLAPWLDAVADNPDQAPGLRNDVPAGRVPFLEPRITDEGPESWVRLEDQPELLERYEEWRSSWDAWAEVERADRPAREFYGSLFSTYVTAGAHAEELELVLGVGCLTWSPNEHPTVRRHLFTCGVDILFDDDSGRLTLTRAEGLDPLTFELDMLDPGLIRSPKPVNDVKSQAQAFEGHPLHRGDIGALTRRVVHTLDAEGEYRDEDTAPPAGTAAAATYAPALILRKRSQQGLVEIFRTIVAQLAEADEVPSGILPLIDPDHEPRSERDTSPGAAVAVDDEIFLPLPVNDQQLKVLKSVDSRAQTVVQGPPGTGKTHTAAALLSHLLAQGKRVLVAAHTDRALHEVRDKLPEAIKPLSVAVVGGSRSDMADLKLAVERIAATASEHDPDDAAKSIEAAIGRIDEFRRERAATYRRLLDAREDEIAAHEHSGYEGTLAAIAQRYQDEADDFAWLPEYVDPPADGDAPLTDDEMAEWRRLLLDADLQSDEPDSRRRLIDLNTICAPEDFASLCAAERDAASKAAAHAQLDDHEAFDAVRSLELGTRAQLQHQMHALAEQARTLEARHESWMSGAVFDVRAGRAGPWRARFDQVHDLAQRVKPLIEQLGPLTQVAVSGGDTPALTLLALHLRQHLAGGGTVKVAADGTPKTGFLSPKPVKDAAPLFEHVRVDGLPPATDKQLGAFLAYVEAERSLDALDRAWPNDVHIPAEDTLSERLQWHVNELAQLGRVLDLGRNLADAEERLAALDIKPPSWTDLESVHAYATLVDAAAAQDALAEASQPLIALGDTTAATSQWDDADACVHQLDLAVRNREHDQYAQAHTRLTRLHQVKRLAARRDELALRLGTSAPELRDAVASSPAERHWDTRLAQLSDAWRWAATGSWILGQQTTDVNALQAQISVYEARIRREVEKLAAARAWSHAVSPERLTGQARADLAQYASLVRRLGKGTGKYAAEQRGAIRNAMDRCRTAVPVWIMPIYRIAEQLRIHENMFDVVLVDEASQAGLEATFLQYLAPKIVVIGDDKQVSPTAVGVDQQQLRDLANQYLAGDRYKDSWLDPKRSLFDEALMRYGGQITLVEHRRCVPEIIGFSNRVAYEPDGVRLIPVRQYGADRLDPVVPVHVPDGYTRGTTQRTNPAEVDAIVDQIEKCLADPRYDGLSMGVISLLGGAQARAIEAKLLDRVPPEEWAARDLRCGDAADFQGSERDVIFLSMVAAPEPGKRLGSLTQELYVQRYNVAASRAKDQMWLFHSVTLQELGNPEDMRFALLDYCYGVNVRAGQDDERILAQAVPEDVRVEPFDSLFEQRVCNRLHDRGYTVIPQYAAEGYNIDLVVVGAQGRLAIECDGDRWHGPDAYERDLARQRDLERCGWQFHRIRESAFYVDQAGVLDGLWKTLAELEIHPSGWTAEPEEAVGTLEMSGEVPAAPDLVVESAPEPTLVEHPKHDVPPSVANLTHLDEVRSEVPPEIPVTLNDPADRPSLFDDQLEPYREFTGTVVPAADADRQQLRDGLVAIVEAEGPVMGQRLHMAYVKAAGGDRVGRSIASILNQAISSAVRQGVLVADNRRDAGVKPRTFRLPSQPETRPRQLGPRALDHVPPTELADLLTQAALANGWEHDETLYREVLARLGLRRLTTHVEATLAAALRLAREKRDAAEQDGADSL